MHTLTILHTRVLYIHRAEGFAMHRVSSAFGRSDPDQYQNANITSIPFMEHTATAVSLRQPLVH